MRAVFLKHNTFEILPPIKNEQVICDGMDEDIKEEHKITITQYLHSSAKESLDFVFIADRKENIEFLEGTFHAEKKDGMIYFYPKQFYLNVVGETKFLYRKEGKEQNIYVRIAPMLDDKIYEEIRKDLTKICIRFLYALKEDEGSRRIKKEYLTICDLQIKQIENSVKELEKTLQDLNRNPIKDMMIKQTTRNFRQVKTLDAKIIVDHYVLKKPKVRVMAHEKTSNIYENKKIYSFIKLLEKRIQELEIENTELTEYVGNRIDNNKLLDEIKKLKKRIHDLYMLNLFRNECFKEERVYPLKTSNLFVNHKKYRRIFQILQNYRKEGQLFEDGLNSKYKNVQNSPNLYEIWCYFKILEILMLQKGYEVDQIAWPSKMSEPFCFEEWKKTDSSKLFSKIQTYINEKENKDSIKSLEGLVIHLINGRNDIYLGYNCTFRGDKVPKSDGKMTSERLRPDIFLILNREIFFACDAKYKNYSKDCLGIQAWYTDLFECAAYKYMYRLHLNDEVNRFDGVLSVHERFAGKDKLYSLKNGGACILTPAISNIEDPKKYNGHKITEKYDLFLEYLKQGKVNININGDEAMDPKEYSIHLKEKISDYEHKVASIRFLPKECQGFSLLFLEALKYGQPHFLEEEW